MAARRGRGQGAGTLFVILGVLAVIGGTFTAGFLSGRHWERVQVMTGLVKPQAGREPARAAPDRAGAIKAPDTQPVPPMTFYQELTAPLASPPPRPTKPEKAKPEPVAPPPKPEPVPKAEPEAPAAALPAPSPKPEPVVKAAPAPPAARPEPAPARGGVGYTVQVAAYATRAQAEALADRLIARGFPADVSETTTDTGVRYRVRVGTWPTREAAREIVARLATDVRLGGFVAPR
jgi:cell division septation protein DedD